MKIYLDTLGCKLNESELEAWARRLGADGYEIVEDARDAEVCIVNTCAITHVAARKSRQLARQLARTNPQARIVLTGCYADTSPGEARALPNVALIVPNAHKDDLVQQISDFRFQISDCGVPVAEPVVSPTFHFQPPTSNLQSPISTLRTRAFVEIQDGCNMSCTYCIIPLARGKERSRAPVQVIAEIQSLVQAGYQEIVLTGVQISTYRNTPTPFSLRDLVIAILNETNVPRLRLTSIAPWEVDPALLEVWRDPRVCRHLHLSLQSGSDAILRAMRRPYTTAQFARAVDLVRAHIPDVGITTDVIVGFPGEGAAEFDASLRFVEQMQFSRVHVFPYSMRDGTPAATMPHQVAETVKQTRVAQVQAVGTASLHTFAARFVGRAMPVLWETREKNAGQGMTAEKNSSVLWSGYTDNYIRVLASSDQDLTNRIVPAQIISVADEATRGVLIN